MLILKMAEHNDDGYNDDGYNDDEHNDDPDDIMRSEKEEYAGEQKALANGPRLAYEQLLMKDPFIRDHENQELVAMWETIIQNRVYVTEILAGITVMTELGEDISDLYDIERK